MLIDTDYNGKHFRIVENVRPEKRNGFINAEYELTLQPISIIAIGVDTDGYCRILGGGESRKYLDMDLLSGMDREEKIEVG